ncbi:MAG: bifunctional UDP-N-acetylmuramoyl-tripeptide:D-alanyl-D-alanine ligase/alanine racemase [Cyclobacteriaceae bacterium]|nr:bifunctional UDP-N-acetylmuramoyl-tripeptide:D-alanyl-D-alanine ligase/alanine racemase [Cyclobacteriaceae bacterium]MCH8515581.1 bifunctional UDP-N-acetylmuramoyl-tripeptide:D-alanyl-D-alanine ligase/alanine racemase [Cyclobacteriaceae bacterium]
MKLNTNILDQEFKSLNFQKQHINLQIDRLFIDSRKRNIHANDLFICLPGEKHHGRNFIPQLIQKGIQFFLGKQLHDLASKYPHIYFWETENEIQALQKLAHLIREQFDGEVIGITGSNAKTIIKEWLGYSLQDEFKICKSPASYNSQIGVPLSVAKLEAEHDLAIFEAGISEPGNMLPLQAIIKPTIGIFTNIGSAHQENFHSTKEKIREKIILFKDVKKLIYCLDHEDIAHEVRLSSIPSITWSLHSQSADFCFSWNEETSCLLLKNEAYPTPLQDSYSIENLCHLIVTLKILNLSTKAIKNKVKAIQWPFMRLELLQGKNDNKILKDVYTNDIEGIEAALEYQKSLQHKGPKTLILSEPSNKSEQYLLQLKQLLSTSGLDQIILIGNQFEQIILPHLQLYQFNTAYDLIQSGRLMELKEELILLKGSQNSSISDLLPFLLARRHGTIFEINLEAIAQNFRTIKSTLNQKTKIMCLVKASAYGTSAYEIANTLSNEGADYLTVAYPEEGVELRKKGINQPIMVLNFSPSLKDLIVPFQLEPEIYELEQLQALLPLVRHFTDEFPGIHIKIETGMNRLGFKASELREVCELILKYQIPVRSVFTHLSSADQLEAGDFTRGQIAKFENAYTLISQSINQSPLRHILNTSGIMHYPEHQMDMVRLGIGIFGFGRLKDEVKLSPVGRVKTFISQIKTVEAGEAVGYGRTFVADKQIKIAILGMGYADGLSRLLGNGKGGFFIKGVFCPTVGAICMDMCMVDVSELRNINKGQEAIWFENQDEVESIAKAAQTIPYEIFTSIGPRVERVFYKE